MTDHLSIPNKDPLEVSLKDLIRFAKKYILLVIGSAVVCGILGIAFSFSVTKKYTAQTILLPEYSMGNDNSFFSMAMGSDRTGAEKLVPELYPNILSSTPFGQYLLKEKITDVNGRKYESLKEYMARDTSVSLLSKLTSIFKSSPPTKSGPPVSIPSPGIMSLSTQEQSRISGAIGLVRTNVDSKNGIITLESELTDPVVAAIVVEASKNYLVNYVEDYRTSKTSEQAIFLESRVTEAKKRQQNAEYALQSYRDHNRSAYLNVARIEEQRLQAEYTLAQSIYSDLIVKLEQARIKVKEERPVFKVLEPTKVPTSRSSPKRLTIGFIFGVIGAVLTMFYIVFFKEKFHLKLLADI
ncbi:Wzz/FepE/Etk N-terminal domain-containing protein [Dyadobacter sp. CY261]|uniref:Wzz/FepE/Etk N-terminal domain-containing protein n=1 Tax=Dyadobacter sp. CY261 TaxID=2907203 RepID=UPI001F23B5B6|nr:Wzz/FepE/Etk N-terminal domain-containing protein [Dyadobacter sp. CY261]MCF0074502.1 Wzz/FepE/Etk N-terminal domain-containing protein [Dyadobacter sp. CY261]